MARNGGAPHNTTMARAGRSGSDTTSQCPTPRTPQTATDVIRPRTTSHATPDLARPEFQAEGACDIPGIINPFRLPRQPTTVNLGSADVLPPFRATGSRPLTRTSFYGFNVAFNPPRGSHPGRHRSSYQSFCARHVHHLPEMPHAQRPPPDAVSQMRRAIASEQLVNSSTSRPTRSGSEYRILA